MRCTDEALVLQRTPFRDTSLLLHFFTRRDGVLSAVARGVRAAGRAVAAQNRAALAGFHTLIIGHQARSPLALATLTGVDLHRPRHRLLHQAPAVLAAQVMQEILYRFLVPREPNPDLFALLEWAWDQLDGGVDPVSVMGIFQGRVLRGLGYGWRTDCCAGCGCREHLRHFSAKRGQVVCDACAAPYSGLGGRDRVAQSTQTLFFLGDSLYAVLQHLEWTTDFESLPREDKAVLYRLGRVCLSRLGGDPLLSDPPFRQLAGLDS